MAIKKAGRTVSFAGALAVLASGWLSAAQRPLDIIKESNRKVMAIVDIQERYAGEIEGKIGAALDEITSFAKISASILEDYRSRLAPAQFEELDGVLRGVLKASLVKKLKRLRVDQLLYVAESIKGDHALVKTSAYYEGEKYDLNYELELADGRWIVVNYIFDNVDAVENYRQQFAELFAKEPYDKIIARLRKKLSPNLAHS